MRHNKSFKKNDINFESDAKREFEFNEHDLIELSLLNRVLISVYLFIIADGILYSSTINSMEYIVSRNNNKRIIATQEAIQSSYLSTISRLILVNVDISRYNHLYKKFANERKEYSLKPELNITIGDGLQVLTYFFITIGFVGIYKVNSIKNISINVTKELSLMISQLYAVNIRFYADYLAYITIIESIQLIYSRYEENRKIKINPDIPAIQSVICYFLSRIILANIAFTRYEELYKKYGKTQYNYLLQPDITISVGNVFGVISSIYLLIGFIQRYERNINGPVFGI